jgi:hypothetical protein
LNISNGFETAECYDNPGGRQEWIDHMWLNPNGTDTEIHSKKVVPIFGQLGTMRCPLSDHYAVEASVKVRQSSQKDLAKSHNLKGKKSTNWF